MKKFIANRVVDSYKLKDVKRLAKEGKLYDFLPTIRRGYSEDMQAMKNWKQHFSERGIPWAVTEEDTYFTMWKEEVIK